MTERDPGADTAMFQAFMQHGDQPTQPEANRNRGLYVATGAVVAVAFALVALLLVL